MASWSARGISASTTPASANWCLCAKVAGEHNDAVLAERILSIIRTASAERDPAGERANFYTFRRFAEILGLLPTSTVTTKDLELVEGWLNTKFDHDTHPQLRSR